MPQEHETCLLYTYNKYTVSCKSEGFQCMVITKKKYYLTENKREGKDYYQYIQAKMQSRLAEVVNTNGPVATAEIVLEGDVESGTASSESMRKFFVEVDELKSKIQQIRDHTAHVARLQDAALNSVRSEDTNRTSNELEKVLSEANRQCSEAKQVLASIKSETDKLESLSTAPASELRIRKNMYQTLTQNFVQAVRTYQSAQQNYQKEMKRKVARQVRIVKPEATIEEIDTAMKSGDTGAVYRAAILQPGADPVALAYQDCQAKYRDVLKLEESIKALNQMFRDLALLVEQQGEMLNQIEFSVEEATEHVKGGNENLKGALEARKSIRKKYMIIALIFVVVIVLLMVFLLK